MVKVLVFTWPWHKYCLMSRNQNNIRHDTDAGNESCYEMESALSKGAFGSPEHTWTMDDEVSNPTQRLVFNDLLSGFCTCLLASLAVQCINSCISS